MSLLFEFQLVSFIESVLYSIDTKNCSGLNWCWFYVARMIFYKLSRARHARICKTIQTRLLQVCPHIVIVKLSRGSREKASESLVYVNEFGFYTAKIHCELAYIRVYNV